MSVTPAVRRLRQEDCEFRASLGYTEFEPRLGYTARPCLKMIKLVFYSSGSTNIAFVSLNYKSFCFFIEKMEEFPNTASEGLAMAPTLGHLHNMESYCTR
jgi:hypothetical protein